ncbi:hypothetical protein ACJMK2_036602 [Sinanodonta woodiana]|uniref:ubiquitinyl hydrolase 1 n=1 Tax=Sinanodonta woodiana TaxID=1069815 RepID=A0ABD3WI28_SINWO
MCDICSDLLQLLDNFEERSQNGGFHMNKKEILSFVLYVCLWPQRQCMCCFKDLRNFEKLNSMIQDALSVGIRIIQTLPDDIEKEIQQTTKEEKCEESKEDEDMNKEQPAHVEDEKDEDKKKEETEKTGDHDTVNEEWKLDEKEKLLQFVTKVFLMNFPSYMAYKHCVHSSLEELSQQETSALNNYCEISDTEVPLFLLRNVCFFCDSNGIGALKQCFEKATPDTLPFNFAHLLITLIANLRLWMNIPTVMQYIIPLRTSVIRYMCKLSDKDLRVAGNRNMTDLMWHAVKEPLESHFNFDRDGLDLAFKYFTCSTLTIRLAGIAQINNQINLYNESCNNETLMDAERVGHHLAQWLIDHKIIEHIFGPNLHVELIKQSQIILNFLAVEGRITNEQIDCIWAAAQLKHCGKQVFDILIPLIKHLELHPVQYLLKLVSALDVAAHTESTLYLASALVKCIWNTYSASQSQVMALQQQQHQHQQQQQQNSYTALQQEELESTDLQDVGKNELSSSESIQVSEDGEDKPEQKDAQKVPATKPVDSQDSDVEMKPVKSVSHKRQRKRQLEGSKIVNAENSDASHESEGIPLSDEEEEEDLSGEEEDEEDEEGEHCHYRHHYRHRHQPHNRHHLHHHVHPHHHELHGHESCGSESDVDTSDSTEGSHEESIEERQRLHRLSKRIMSIHGKGLREQRSLKRNLNEDSSEEMDVEEDEEEEEEEESDYVDSENEILKQAKIISMKHEHACHGHSEESSDYEDDVDYQQIMKTPLKPEYQELLKQQLKHTQRQLAIQRATQMMMAKKKHKIVQVISPKVSPGNLPNIEDLEATVQVESGNKVSNEKEGSSGEKQSERESSQHMEESPAKKTEENSVEMQVFDCSSVIQKMHAHKQGRRGEYVEGIRSPDDGSCHSSRLSAKSEKNMADFDGEDLLSDDELAQINAHAHFNAHQMQQHLSNLASMYHTHMPHAVVHHRPVQKEQVLPVCSDYTFDDVCQRGNTLLWDLVQDDGVMMLPEGLAMEAEKVLCSLVCFSTDRKIRMKFIEACIENVAHHRSVVVSLRLLPKIFNSFQQYRSGADTHSLTMWAEKDLNMMAHFFIDLVHYTELVTCNKRSTNSLYSHKEEIQVRLSFLTYVFTSMGSPDSFRLDLEQVDTLWSCLALDPECSDDCLSWFLNQAKSKDHHAMGLETFKHIFLQKMPQLNPESMCMTGLNLFQQLSHLSRIANASSDNPLNEDKVSGMDQLWSIALRALDTDVSITAIQYLNNYYINYGNGILEKEEEFVKRCMESLVKASDEAEQDPETNLLIIQRGLVLMKNHLEAFRKRYAYHLRNWQIDGRGVSSHQRSLVDKQAAQIRILLQPAGMGEKTPLEMSSTDLIAELRAEVARWWESLQKQTVQQQDAEGCHGNSLLTPILGAMLGDGPIRLITLGQELTCDMDEKTLGEMQFKDNQLVFVSVGASRTPRKMDGTLPSSCLPAPTTERLPMMLLIQEPYFGQLMNMLEKLSKLNVVPDKIEGREKWDLLTKARVLSRKVWELLMLLPTNITMLQGFRSVTSDKDSDNPNWNELLNAQSPHRLMYSLQIVEGLCRSQRHRKKSFMRLGGGDSHLTSTDSELSLEGLESPEQLWSKRFVTKGGLSHMFNIFICGGLQMKETEPWSQWEQECLACLLRLISQFSVDQSDSDCVHDDVFETFESPRKKQKKQKGHDKILIPRLNQTILSMLKVDSVLQILMNILYDAALPGDSNQMHAGSWGRSEVVHYVLSFLVSWALSCDEVRESLCSSPNFDSWLKRLTLEAPEPHVRKEACAGLYHLCLGKTVEGKTGYPFLLPILSRLLTFLEDALQIKPQKNIDVDQPKEKEPFGPGCRDYFWLLCRFVDNISKEDASPDSDNPVNLNVLAKKLSVLIVDRPFYETRHGYEEDEGLIGVINLCTTVIKHNPPFKSSLEPQELIEEIFQSLFALPSPEKRYLPRCKSQTSRSAAYDLLVEICKGNLDNYMILHNRMLHQHTKDSHASYPWDYWPHEDGRSKCGYVGLTNLGATCYMATCMQHLYMIPQARQSVLQAKHSSQTKHEGTLVELQKMFAYLQESERKAYNPRGFCKAYTMDKQPLNTGEQKDMTEFFIDLITKLEEMSFEMKKLVKSLFGGVITNNVVSLDCPHVSRTLEEFYTVRCQVSDMKNLYESLDEVTVKDMLEGDNMYTCSKCQKKVRAEKRACFRKLPKILCFNTMRYTFNMVTMMKEKVNTHFSFPLRLDMSDYMEKNLISQDKLQDDEEDNGFIEKEQATQDDDIYEYELNGVTVHTGTADGGHYYSFIRDKMNKSETGQDKWFLFNDAEVKPFDPSQIAAECFGGEMTSKTYDSVTEKFMDFSFEKTNSAYMLFYERLPKGIEGAENKERMFDALKESPKKFNFELSKELEEWIWQDNMQFLQDKNIFEHTYFDFMWQVCGYIPTTLPKTDPLQVSLKVAQLSTSFVLETFIHAKEKPTMVNWIEFLTKQFNSCQAACEWFLDHMAESDWWPQQILIKCPNQMVRQMFQRLLIHVITRLRPAHVHLFLQPFVDSDDGEVDVSEIGSKSCVTRFIKKMLAILEHGVRPHSKHLAEYFAFLFEFAKLGDEDCFFLIHTNAISTMVSFYMGQKAQENYVEILSDDEEDDVITLTEENYKPLSLDKMISLIALLVEKSRGDDHQLQISDKDYNAIIGGGSKGFPFLFNQIRDNINVRQTCNLIFSLCRWNEGLAVAMVNMVFSAIKKMNPELSQPFFKLMSMLVEFQTGPPGMPPFTQYILQKFWELTACCPQQCLEWMSTQVTRNKLANAWVLNQMDNWVEPYLMKHNNVRVRNASSFLLVSLVPSNHFRQSFRTARSILSPHKEMPMTQDAILVLHQIYDHLLNLLPRAKLYVDPQTHGTTKLMCYFAVMSSCLISKTEKIMFSRYFLDLWQLFQPKLSEPQISMHHNKQALLHFWHQVCVDCPENVKLIVSNPHVCKHIPFTYILADHEDQDVVMFNRVTLPAYYGLLRMCCQQSRPFTRQLAQHQNIQWAFKNITPYPAQYTAAVDELFRMMRLMSTVYPDSSDEEVKAVNAFKKNTVQLYLQSMDARSCWQTLISAFKILVETAEDRIILVTNRGLPILTEAFHTLHVMYHEATACHVTGDIVDLLSIILNCLKVARYHIEKKGVQIAELKMCLLTWKEWMELVKKLLTLLNSYTSQEIRLNCIDLLKELILTYQSDCVAVMVPILTQAHITFQDSNIPMTTGPYFPRRGQKPVGPKSNIRPPRPQFNMMLHSSLIEASKGVDDAYDTALSDFFIPYHILVDLICRMAVNNQMLTEPIINLSAMVAYEGVPLHSPYFAKLWYEIYHSEIDKKCISILCSSSFFIDYVDAVIMDERICLANQNIYQFFCNFFPKVYQQVLNEQGRPLLDSVVASITAEKAAMESIKTQRELLAICSRIVGDLRAMLLIFSVQPPKHLNQLLMESLQYIMQLCREHQQQRAADAATQAKMIGRRRTSSQDSQDGVQAEHSAGEKPSKRRRLSSKGEEERSSSTENPENNSNEDLQEKNVEVKKTESSIDEDKVDSLEQIANDKVTQETEKMDSETLTKETNADEKREVKGTKSPKRAYSPKPGTSKDLDREERQQQDSGSDSSDQSGSNVRQQGSDSDGASVPRTHVPRERPTLVDLVAKHIESLFSLLAKNN